MSLEAMSAELAISMGSLSRIEREEQWPDRAVIERVVEITDGEVTANDFIKMPAHSEARQ